jgi:ATP-dependent DNA ligase
MDLTPMLAMASNKAFPDLTVDQIRGAVMLDPTWSVQPKYDGIRALVMRGEGLARPGRTRVMGRDGQQAARALPAGALEVLDALPFDRLALDCEVVDGQLWIFDVPVIDTIVNPSLRWDQRRLVLDAISPEFPKEGPVHIARTAVGEDREWMWAGALAAGIEGLILRRTGGVYLPGQRGTREVRSPNVVKVKFTKTVDCVVTGFGIGGKNNIGLGMWSPGGDEPTPVGEVSRLTGDGPRVRLGDVVEVTVLGASAHDRLVQPVCARLRRDKPARQCTIDQLDTCRINKTPLVAP